MKKELPWFVAWPVIVMCFLIGLYLLTGAYGVLAVKYSWGKKFPYAVTGRSMEPTIHQPIQITVDDYSLSFGALVWVDRLAEKAVNSIVLFRTPDGQLSVKRITKELPVNETIKKYWLDPDNAGVTGEGSGFGQYDWVHQDKIIGVVTKIWTPRRALWQFAAMGRLKNEVEFYHAPSAYTVNGRFIAVGESGLMQIFGAEHSSSKPVFEHEYRKRVPNLAVAWRNGKVVFMSSPLPHIYTLFDPLSGQSYQFDAGADAKRVVTGLMGKRFMVIANQDDAVYLGTRGEKPMVSVDDKVIQLCSPEADDPLAKWSGTGNKVAYVNCLFYVEISGE